MKFRELYRRGNPVISLELFPPKTDAGVRKLEERIPRLIELKPGFVSVTYGAMGTTRERTLELAAAIRREHGVETAHHLTCVGATRAELDRVLQQIAAQGIQNVVALRGDPPQGTDVFQAVPGGFEHAYQLVTRIREAFDFGIAVAGYPEKHVQAPDFKTDLQHLKTKVDAGADVIITQLFYENRHFFRFVDQCRQLGIEVPIIPGLLPIMDVHQFRRITGMCGASIPKVLLDGLLEADGDEARVLEIGLRHTVRQAEELLESGVEGIHFYVLNQHFHISEILRRINFRIG